MGVPEGRMAERLRRLVLGDHGEITAQLQREVAELRAALRDPAMVRALIIEALYEEARSAPAEVAAALRPAMEGMLPQPQAEQRSRHRWPWLSGTTALAITAVVAVLSQANVAAVSSASARASAPLAPGAVSAHVPVSTIWEDLSMGFGLGQAHVADGKLAREVDRRLASCNELAGARIHFSVKDGWVWLRGEATASGRAAADRSLADLGDGVLVVNQLTVVPPQSQLSAR